MAAQATIAANHSGTFSVTGGIAVNFTPQGKNSSGVLKWHKPGDVSALGESVIDLSYRTPTKVSKTQKSMVRVLVPKTALDSMSVENFIGLASGVVDFSFPQTAEVAEKVYLYDLLLTTLASAAVKTAITTGDVMY